VEQLPNAFIGTYRTELMSAIRGLDLEKVTGAIDLFLDARARGRRIFLCGSGSAAAIAVNLLRDGMKNASPKQLMRFRVMMLDDQKPIPLEGNAEGVGADHSFVEQLKTHAEPGDLVVAISSYHAFLDVVQALRYAEWIGCPTISITRPISKAMPASRSHVAIELSHSDQGSVEGIQLVLCHMIGRSFCHAKGT
jgi:D-sedoheptulose 7-phosphate isomerase